MRPSVAILRRPEQGPRRLSPPVPEPVISSSKHCVVRDGPSARGGEPVCSIQATLDHGCTPICMLAVRSIFTRAGAAGRHQTVPGWSQCRETLRRGGAIRAARQSCAHRRFDVDLAIVADRREIKLFYEQGENFGVYERG